MKILKFLAWFVAIIAVMSCGLMGYMIYQTKQPKVSTYSHAVKQLKEIKELEVLKATIKCVNTTNYENDKDSFVILCTGKGNLTYTVDLEQAKFSFGESTGDDGFQSISIQLPSPQAEFSMNPEENQVEMKEQSKSNFEKILYNLKKVFTDTNSFDQEFNDGYQKFINNQEDIVKEYNAEFNQEDSPMKQKAEESAEKQIKELLQEIIGKEVSCNVMFVESENNTAD